VTNASLQDDTLKDINRNTALDVAKGPEVAKYIQGESRLSLDPTLAQYVG
jgi:hypothetical protein